jgi:hypothetical protein
VIRLVLLLLLLTLSKSAFAQQFVSDLKVVQIGAYQYSPGHYVWFSVALPGCTTTAHFDETKPGGKALLALLTTALVNGRKVDVRYDVCDITEIYLK